MHALNLKIQCCPLYLSNILKALPEMGLYCCGIFGLREDLQQFVVGQEVESWEGVTFCLQVLAEALLYLFQQLVTLLQVVQQPAVRAKGDNLGNTTQGRLLYIKLGAFSAWLLRLQEK